MPRASPPLSPQRPAPISEDEQGFVTLVVKRFYGDAAIVRNYGPDPERLDLHVETDIEPGMERYDCLGVLLTRIDRKQISLEVTKRGEKPRGSAKIAYRQGIII